MKTPREAASLKDLLTPGASGLGRVLARAADLEALTARVVAALPAPEAEHVVAVSARDTGLVVTVDSAAWAARLRFMEKEVREAIGHAFAGGQYSVRVRPPADR